MDLYSKNVTGLSDSFPIKQMDGQLNKEMGNGCGSVGRAVASDIRNLRFKSSPRQ